MIDPLFRQIANVDRRGFLKAGVLGTGGLALPDLLRFEAEAGQTQRKKSVIILWMRGGPSQLETWDMKPEAPAEIRGEFNPIDTNVPGIQICEYLPLSAKLMDKWSIIRSMHFRKEDGNPGHSSGDQICFTGYKYGSNPDQNVYPSVGSVTKRQLHRADSELPTYVMIPRNVPGTSAGYFGPSFEPFETQSDPANNGKFEVRNLSLSDKLSTERIEARTGLLNSLDRTRRDLDTRGAMEAMDEFHQQAIGLITGDKVQRAFDLDSEPQEVRERYGFHGQFKSRVRAGGDAPNWPQRMLLARRLVEAGVRLVTVDCRWWDTHEDNFWSLKNGFLPRWDQAYSALIEELDQRGLLETTMVLAWGEMGRTPRINKSAGRDHWSEVMNVAVAGGGIQGGRVIGSSDPQAAVPQDNPKLVQDMLATVYGHLGVDTTVNYTDHSGRPHPVLPCGSPINELF